jgi:hypothetical protein
MEDIVNQYLKKLDKANQVIHWYIDGKEQLGGSLSLFLSIPPERIEELYNVKFN